MITADQDAISSPIYTTPDIIHVDIEVVGTKLLGLGLHAADLLGVIARIAGNGKLATVAPKAGYEVCKSTKKSLGTQSLRLQNLL